MLVDNNIVKKKKNMISGSKLNPFSLFVDHANFLRIC